MPILKLNNISLSYSNMPLLNKAELTVDAKEKICLVGRNGAGKSSLLDIITGKIQPDAGQIWTEPQLKIAKLDQDLPEEKSITIFDYVAEGLENVGNILKQYHDHLALHQNDEWLKTLEKLQKDIDRVGGWHFEQKISSILTTLNLDPDTTLDALSGGWRRRVALARALVSEPDLLLLDEPTNHLDIESILWMEKHLLQYQGSIICISHDRALVDKIATRIVELDRGDLFSYPGNFTKYLELKAKRLEDEDKQNSLFDKKLAEEEVWIRQGIKARRTRNEGRVRALKELRKERAARLELIQRPAFNINKSEISGKLVVDAENVNFSIDNKKIIKNFSTKILRGDKIGIVGPNGCGKTTLLKLLLGEILPDSGKINIGTNLDIAYFDQLRNKLDFNISAIDNIAHGRTSIDVNGKTKHIISYLQDFLFTPDKARTLVQKLSGGERNRLLLARLFSLPANLLVLDEPTNDLDFETLELLEDLLIDFPGTVLIVSHDRSFIDNVTTQVIAFKDNGDIAEYIGSYAEWSQNLKSNTNSSDTKYGAKSGTNKAHDNKPDTNKTNNNKSGSNKFNKTTKQNAADNGKQSQPETNNQLQNSTNNQSSNIVNKQVSKNLSYKEEIELKSIHKKIAQVEEQLRILHAEISNPSFYSGAKDQITQKLADTSNLEKELEKLYSRWESIEE